MRLYIPVYTVTLFLSAFLLFLIQPLFSKMILPLLGGSPAVWNTAMLFFQAMLLAGYAYAHFIAHYLKPRLQALIHLALLLLFTLVLPVAIPEGWEPPATSNPAWWQLSLMAVAVGGPFFVLAGTAPLLQHWFSHTDHPEAGNPYFLYAASNLGSMSALIAYPIIVEPFMTLGSQTLAWAYGYGILFLGIALSSLFVKKKRTVADIAEQRQAATPDTSLKLVTIGIWLLLAFIPSSVMLGVTTFITTDLAPVPLLWVVPLALYVGTFVIAFARRQIISLQSVHTGQAYFLVLVIASFLKFFPVQIGFTLIVHLGLFTFTALLCHIQLARLRPSVKHLTAFYLIMSTGGVLGGIFNALVAPLIFLIPVEYVLALSAGLFVRHLTRPEPERALPPIKNFKKTDGFILVILACALAMILVDNTTLRYALSFPVFVGLFFYAGRRWQFAIIGIFLLLSVSFQHWIFNRDYIYRDRNFFGILTVFESDGYRLFRHGTTVHGLQSTRPENMLTPMGYYYNKNTPVADVFSLLDTRPGPQKIGDIGLGIGMLACYSKDKRNFDFYEIDPDVVEIAENPNLFSYLSDCRSSYKIIIGDGRLKLQEAPDKYYDLLFVDAFSSDNIPIHLLTLEAFELYRRKVKDDGIIAIHISNRYLNLQPIIATIASELEMYALFGIRQKYEFNQEKLVFPSHLAVLAATPDILEPLEDKYGWIRQETLKKRVWRDNYTNIFHALAPLNVKLPVPVEEKN